MTPSRLSINPLISIHFILITQADSIRVAVACD